MKDFLNYIAKGFADQADDACIIANMHALPTVSQLFEVALNKGFSPSNILFIGKPYSTIHAAKHEITSMGIGFASVFPQFPAGQLVPLHNQILKEQLAEWCPPRELPVLRDQAAELFAHADLRAARTSIQRRLLQE